MKHIEDTHRHRHFGAHHGRHGEAHAGERGGGRGWPGHGGGFGGPGGGRHGDHGGRGGGRRRMFDSGELRLVLLALLEAQPRHGYDFIREIEDRTGGAYAPSPGVVYPTLSLLQDLGQIEETEAEGAKRLFAVTEAGRAHLAEKRAEADAALARLDALGAETSRIDAGPVRRALHNLHAVLHDRLAGEPERQTLLDAAELIDEAARKIERL